MSQSIQVKAEIKREQFTRRDLETTPEYYNNKYVEIEEVGDGYTMSTAYGYRLYVPTGSRSWYISWIPIVQAKEILEFAGRMVKYV